MPRILSIGLPVLLTLIVTAGLIYVLSIQIINFLDDAPELNKKLTQVGASAQKWVNQHIHVTVRKQNEYIKETVEGIKDNSPKLVGVTFGSITGIVAYIILLPIYTFLMLYYRTHIKTFLIGVFKNGSEDKVKQLEEQLATATAWEYDYYLRRLGQRALEGHGRAFAGNRRDGGERGAA
jgi:predicted PurR-regulated permease PerM